MVKFAIAADANSLTLGVERRCPVTLLNLAAAIIIRRISTSREHYMYIHGYTVMQCLLLSIVV